MKDHKFCKDCQQWKPFEEFYSRKLGENIGYLVYCKECYKVRNKQQPKGDKQVSAVKSEGDLIKILWKQGIPALPGKSLSHKYADVVCWSCVMIEVKHCPLGKRGHFTFSFSYSQLEHGIRGHIVALVCDWGNETTYHLFDAKSPMFYKADGKLKTRICFTPVRKQSGKKAVFTPESMAEAKDNWGLIEEYRKSISEKLINGADFVHEVRQVGSKQRKQKI